MTVSRRPQSGAGCAQQHTCQCTVCVCVCIAQVAAQLRTLRRCRKYFLLRALKFADSKDISNGSYKLWWNLHFVSCTVSCTIVVFSDFSNTRFDLIINYLFSFRGHVNKCFPSTNCFFSVKLCSLNFIELIFVASEVKDANRQTDTFQFTSLTLILLTWKIWRACNNTGRWDLTWRLKG